MAAGDRAGRDESEGVSAEPGGGEDAEGGAELPVWAAGVDESEPRKTEDGEEGAGVGSEGEGWPEWAGSAEGGSGVGCDGGAIAAGSRATSRRAEAGWTRGSSTRREVKGRGSVSDFFARSAGAKLVVSGVAIVSALGGAFSPNQRRARPPRTSARIAPTTNRRRRCERRGDGFLAGA